MHKTTLWLRKALEILTTESKVPSKVHIFKIEPYSIYEQCAFTDTQQPDSPNLAIMDKRIESKVNPRISR